MHKKRGASMAMAMAMAAAVIVAGDRMRLPAALTGPTAMAATGRASSRSTSRYGACAHSEPRAPKSARCCQATVPAAKAIAKSREFWIM